MKILLVVAIAFVAILGFLLYPKTPTVIQEAPAIQRPELNTLIQEFLVSKKSPLAPETDFLLEQKHWKLLIAISAIESQYCKRQLGYNCWGIGGDSAYRHYSSYQIAIVDANNLIEKWQQKGRWLTVSDMNGSYVQPHSPNWERVVNQVLGELNVITGTN